MQTIDSTRDLSFLRWVSLFRGFDDRMLQAIAHVLTSRRLAPGGMLCSQGEPGNACFIIAVGKVEVVITAGADEQVVAELGPGQVVGELSLIDGGRRSASVRARAEVEALCLQRSDFDRLLAAGNQASMLLLDNIACDLARRVRGVNQRFADLFSRTGETIEQLSGQLQDLRGTTEVSPETSDGEDGQPTREDLLKMIGYQDPFRKKS